MSQAKIENIEAEMTARMKSGKPFTALDLYGKRPTEAYRLADRLIQRWRKKGWIAFIRDGRQAVWSLTDLGRQSNQ